MKYPKISELPYYSTQVSEEKSKNDIDKLLDKYECDPIFWLKSKANNKLLLRFGIASNELNNRIDVEIDIPEIKCLKNKKISIVPRRVSLRILFYYLKTTLEAIRFGVIKSEDIFFAFTYVQLTEGSKPVRVKDILESRMLLTEGSVK